MFRQKPPMQLSIDGWWEKLLPNQNADAPCDVNPNPTRNRYRKTFFFIDFELVQKPNGLA